jgi:hypothetical protein
MINYSTQHDYLFTILPPDRLGYPPQILALTEGRSTRIPLQAEEWAYPTTEIAQKDM